ncbi:hypothetical protein CHARACLAT_029397 [Characodon lateralis]|uniref:Uncharacterized protein n=1 Tax=Characodon lateralis TaxID=208331 RepID=A0ABU7EDU5_9TELE|nr:hypothetical protein [Characodon lateralis]
MQVLLLFVKVTKELSQKAKFWLYQSVCIPTLTCGHGIRIMTQMMGSEFKLPLWGGRVHHKRSGEELYQPRAARSRISAPLHQNESVEVVWATDQDVSSDPPFRGFLQKTHWEETPVQAKITLQGMYIPSGQKDFGFSLKSWIVSLWRGISRCDSWICCAHILILDQ